MNILLTTPLTANRTTNGLSVGDETIILSSLNCHYINNISKQQIIVIFEDIGKGITIVDKRSYSSFLPIDDSIIENLIKSYVSNNKYIL